MRQTVRLVLKAAHCRTLILLGLVYWADTGLSELPLDVFCIRVLWNYSLCGASGAAHEAGVEVISWH